MPHLGKFIIAGRWWRGQCSKHFGRRVSALHIDLDLGKVVKTWRGVNQNQVADMLWIAQRIVKRHKATKGMAQERHTLGANRCAQGIGVFVDDITLPDGTSTSFETGLDGWAIAGPPEGSAPNVNNFIRTDSSGFPVGNAIATPHSLLVGFGLEGVSTEAERNEVMARALDHLLP